MTRWGSITVECDRRTCPATVEFAPGEIEDELAELLKNAGWRRRDDKDICPQCVAEEDGPADDPDAWSGGFAENH